jgi:C-terminal processing protease CtpA/Prc
MPQLRRVIAVFYLVSCLSLAQTSYERLAATAKLWAHVKYVHPRVTSPGVDWDAAFVQAAPKVLNAKTEAEFAAAVGEMLAFLKDEETRVWVPVAADTRARLALRTENGVTIAQLEPGPRQTPAQLAELLPKVASVPLVLDFRGSRVAAFLLPTIWPVDRESIGPSMLMRKHSGYANDAATGSGGYESLWESQDGVRLPAAPNPIRPVILVNSRTSIPTTALSIQNSGAGAIVSEDAISDQQIAVSQIIPVLGNLRVQVRGRELAYPDGTTGLAANAVLNKGGDEALKAAIEMARSGKWPAPGHRQKLTLPPARYAEKNYVDQPFPAAEYRMLAAARIWGVFHYFHPYQHLYGEDWDAVLTEFLSKMTHAETARDYHLAVAEMVSHTHDSHCSVSSPELAQFYGVAFAGVEVRWIENRVVITRVVDPALKENVHPGDVVTKIDGEPVQRRMDQLQTHLAASTPQALMNRVMGSLLSGPPGSESRVTLKTGDGGEREMSFPRASGNRPLLSPYRNGEVFRMITATIGYVDLERVTNAEVDRMFDKLKDTQGIVMDMRGYPQGTAWSIAPRLAEKPAMIAAEFRRNLVSANGIEHLLFEQPIPTTDKPRYKGKTVMLIDERAISQSEHSGLFYRTANGTVFIGSPTQGANGDVTYFMAPGGIRINFSGHDVRWPDGRQLQRVGLLPDIEVRPTIAGIQSGRDEVLERAVAYLEKGK